MEASPLGQVIATTVELALVTTFLLLLLATPLAWWLARSRRWWKEAIGAVTALPLVLPPTVIGFYVLVAVAPDSPLMTPLHAFGVRTLAFTFTGLVIGSLFYSLPFAVQPLRTAFEAVDPRLLELAATMGAAPLDRFVTVAAPLARRGFLSAAILVFAHTIGEFGVVLMIGGAVPGRTEVLSTRIYQLVESMNYGAAHRIAAGLVAFGFVALLALLLVERRLGGVKP
ncbi:molybdate ABC transporter permease subunit [Sphingomonas nostoxanthinifaciens]|uniref:molybdate ABC transporter permease subunit n=1 Tax=Sphingomonas nostoxanthinifaciens TaxID=2872652 RepID=UPI001CC1EFD7|nr:molybdate ABC transporter permease subunit [Sphingomonas nostoxanthinifaciens]UAK23467.1 molybdate ABC transporter permease subunit [Sphingomonas nostoxanthinifaciens]